MALPVIQHFLHFLAYYVVFHFWLWVLKRNFVQRAKILHHRSQKFALSDLKILGLDLLWIHLFSLNLHYCCYPFWNTRRFYLDWRQFCLFWCGNCGKFESFTWHKHPLCFFNIFHFWIHCVVFGLLLCWNIDAKFSYIRVCYLNSIMLRVLSRHDSSLLWCFDGWNRCKILQQWSKKEMAKAY